MGTRGYIVLVINGRYFLLWNQLDSYPAGLGVEVITELVQLLTIYTIDELKTQFLSLKLVFDDTLPTAEDNELLKPYSAPEQDRIRWEAMGIDSKKYLKMYVYENNWHTLLRGCQGSLITTLDSGYLYSPTISSEDEYLEYIKDNIFIEYIYKLDFDKNEFYCNDIYIQSLTKVTTEELMKKNID